MRVSLTIVLVLAACSDPTKVAPTPTVGAIGGNVVTKASQTPVPGVQVTIQSFTDTSYAAQDVTDSLGTFFQGNVPAGAGQFQLRHLPTGCDSLLVAPFNVVGGQRNSTSVELPCGS